MSRISPKPIIARVAHTWSVPPGLKVALVEDVAQNVWIVESCPAGTQCWTVAQAAQLKPGPLSRHAFAEAVREGQKLEAAKRQVVADAVPASRELPSVPMQQEESHSLAPVREKARPTRRRIACGNRELARV